MSTAGIAARAPHRVGQPEPADLVGDDLLRLGRARR